MKIFTLIFIFTILLFLFKNYKIYYQKKINKHFNKIKQQVKSYNNIELQHEPYNYSDIYELGVIKTFPFKHPNDIDFNLAELGNNMNILDCGCGVLGPTIYFNSYLQNSYFHVISNDKGRYKKQILSTIKNNNLQKNIKPYFINYENMDKVLRKNYYDRILFIESINYTNKINYVLNSCYKLLKSGGKVYIRTITAPKTKNMFLLKQHKKLEEKLQMNLFYHDNIIHYLQKNNYKNIKYSSIPLVLSDNFQNPIFLLSLNKLNISNLSDIISLLPLSICTYIASK